MSKRIPFSLTRSEGAIAWSVLVVSAALVALVSVFGAHEHRVLVDSAVDCLQCSVGWNETVRSIPIVPESIPPLLTSTSATAASLLVAVIAFLYNVLGSLRRQNYDAYLQYIEARLRYQNDLHQKLKGTGCSFAPKGDAGTRGDFDFEWTSETYSPVTFNLARPDTIKSDFPKLVQPDTEVILADSVNPKSLYNLDDPSSVEQILAELSTKDMCIVFVWVFVEDAANRPLGTLHVQTIFLSSLPKRMQSLSKSLKMLAVAVAAFVATIALSLFFTLLKQSGLFALLTYSMGWGLLLFGVKQILSLIRTVPRKQKLARPEGQIVLRL